MPDKIFEIEQRNPVKLDMTCRFHRYISFTKNAEGFTSNHFLKYAQVKKLKCVTLFSYELKK